MPLIDYVNSKKPFCHFSVDDVFRIFTDRSQGYDFLKSLYDDYGTVTSLYAFSRPSGREYLPAVADGAMKEASWLRYGPHAPEWSGHSIL